MSKKREKQFEKTIDDVENIKCLAQYLIDAIRTGEDPDGEGKDVDLLLVKTICGQIREFVDSTIDDYWEECDKQAGNEDEM